MSSTAGAERPSRRLALRRKVVTDDDSDVENIAGAPPNEDNDDEDFTSADTKASSRRRTTASDTGRRPMSRYPKITDSTEPSHVFSPPESVADESVSPVKKSAPKRRSIKDARAARMSRVSIIPDAEQNIPPLPTPQTTASPEPAEQSSTPLSDITETTVNEQTPRRSRDLTVEHATLLPDNEDVPAKAESLAPENRVEVKKIDAQVTHLEKPMDIVVRTRALGIPQSQESGGAKARMTITYLTLVNFKSYAGKQVVGPFHASFSSVVGPNGSGKSNVIDSLLFVFGFRASKMRQGKISALIHNSAAHPDLDFCEVEVHFQEVLDQPGGATTVVPDSQLVISRRAFKNNSSKYYINGGSSDFTTVTTLLKGRGIDLDHKRFLILQGEVESIAQMKPKAVGDNDDGLLEYLEDIIGTSKYKTPIEEAANETEALNEVCLEKSGRVQHVEKEKNSLEDKKNKALAYIQHENELASKQSALYQIYVAECGDNIQVTDEAVQHIQQQLDDELQRHRGNEDEIKAMEKQYKQETKACDKLEQSTQAILKEMSKLDKDAVKLEEKKKFLINKAKKSEKACETAKFGIQDSKTQAKQAEDDVARLTSQIGDLEEQMSAEDRVLAKIRDELKGKTQGISNEIAAKQKQLEPWTAKINDKRSAVAVAQSELDIIRERENAGSNAVAEIEAKIAAWTEQRTTKAGELKACKSRREAAESELSEVDSRLSQLAAEEPGLKSKLSGAREKADEAHASLSASQAQGNVLTGLTRLKDSGRIDGFHGRLGNLGTIDSKYDVAISTACPALDNLVVDTVEVGQQCIEYLRKNNLGRANFILLDRLAERDLCRIQTPENVPRLFDLVKSKHEQYLPAFYSIMQNTLVAKDLEQANRIAFGAKRWRVVTLDGQLIDKSGTMTGGGKRVAKGAMSSKLVSQVSKDQIAKLDIDREALEKEYETLQHDIAEQRTQLWALQEQLPSFGIESQKISLDVDSVDRNIADAQQRISQITSEQQSSKTEKQKIAILDKTIANLQAEINQLQAEASGTEQEIQALQDKIMEIGGVKLRGQKAKVDGLKEQIELLSESLGSAEVSKAKAEKQAKKHEQTHEACVTELAKIAKDTQAVDDEINNQTTDTSGFRRQADEAQQALDEKKEQLEELKARLDQQTAELNETRGAEVELRNKLEDNNKVLVENHKRLRYWQEKLGKLTLHNVSEDGEEKDPEPVPELSRDELEDLDKEDLKAAIAGLEEHTSQHVEVSVLAEYRRRVNEYSSRLEDLNGALTARDSAKKRTDDLRRLRLEGFMEGFSVISLRLKEMYQMITMGGNAELELVDSLDPFSEGILFSVMPPKKSWKNISNLSGGEKTLSSLALVFALHHYKPTPLYVMDEIDAALDFRNVSIVAAYIKERTKNAQFIVISLRNNMFELASRLVGVYKTSNMTKSVTIENKEYITAR
ncbi:hypothetical protein AMS68_006266 [Peltaster fructicola]|uniref:Structural maintenance of chromosomes protein n=1 Tax=Peltaster fructicola TaxID=286661 RepID=A0A6H0Y1K4_9PEZI|nr:hypothetical protein AMS68_006266 [Peltaster fructicola]